MSAIPSKDYILEAIDQLRIRKARPDLQRICHFVQRRYSVTPGETEADLERMVDAEHVFKVDYKGSVSYRNAATWVKNENNNKHKQIANNNNATSDRNLIHEAIREIVCTQTGDGRDPANYVLIKDLEKSLQNKSRDRTRFTRKHIDTILEQEISSGDIIRVDADTVAENSDKKKRPAPRLLSGARTQTDRLVARSSNRVGLRRKRARKIWDPSDGVAPKQRVLGRPPTEGRCALCMQSANKNSVGKKEPFIMCKDCKVKVHPSCLDYSEDLTRRVRQSPWQCLDCKTCVVCTESSFPDSLLFCDWCDQAYHMTCHHPRVKSKPNGKWICSKCPGGKKETDHINSQTFIENPVMEKYSKVPEDVSIPDASYWSVDEVVRYFKEKGFDDESHSFKDNEIDGRSLLLMTRMDVLTGLGLKLGPALKTYHQVKKLQLRRNVDDFGFLDFRS